MLKGLDFTFSDEKMKIYITHPFFKYENIKLCFYLNEDYLKWKNYVSLFRNDIMKTKYKYIERIGKGKFSKVYKVKSKLDLKYYALKIIEEEELSEDEKLVLLNEARIMQVLHHPNIVKYYESSKTHNSY